MKLINSNLFVADRRVINATDNELIIKDCLLLFQFFIYNSKSFESISPVLSTLIKFLKHNDKTIVSQSCHTLLIFCQSFQQSRTALIKPEICGKLIDLWVNTDDEAIARPIFSIMKSLLVRFNDYKNRLLSKELNILEMMPKLVRSSESNALFVCQLIQMIAMKPINAKKFDAIEQINLMVRMKTLRLVNDLLQSQKSFAIKSSAMNALFVMAHNSTIDQLRPLSEQGLS